MRRKITLSYEVEIGECATKTDSESIARLVRIKVPDGLGYGGNLVWRLDPGTITVEVGDVELR